MAKEATSISRRLFIGAAVAFGAALAYDPIQALAVTSAEKQAEADEVRNQLVSLQADLEAAANEYYAALERREAAQAAMDAAQEEINAATARIEVLQEHLGARMREMYRNGPTTYLDFMLGASSFEEFTNNWDLLASLNDNDADMVEETQALREERQAAHDEFARQEAEYAKQAQIAEQIANEIQVRIDEATVLVEQLDEEARRLLEEEQAAAAAAAAAEAARQAALSAEVSGGSYGGGSSYVVNGTPGDNSAAASWALTRIGCPYVWGAEGPDAFDCSGLVRWSYLQIGMSLPHYTESLYACATNIVSVSEARPGDVLYRYGHVGIAVGYGGVPYVHAPTFGAYVRDTDALSWSGFTAALQF